MWGVHVREGFQNLFISGVIPAAIQTSQLKRDCRAEAHGGGATVAWVLSAIEGLQIGTNVHCDLHATVTLTSDTTALTCVQRMLLPTLAPK